ncbi:hypothetical protein [Corynebacterium singulare]|uniref:hypothetical protein n=1 Tax=Corynebacterium singulare TaxID=161899 RepID=UPI0011A1E853|nr:hypothetical protein [Corynebacterium singulare]
MNDPVRGLCNRIERLIEVVDGLNSFFSEEESVPNLTELGQMSANDLSHRTWLQDGVEDVLARGLDVALFQAVEQFYRDRSQTWARKISSLQLPKSDRVMEKLVKRQFYYLGQGSRRHDSPLDDRTVLESVHSFSGDGIRLSLSDLAFEWDGANLQFSQIKGLLDDFSKKGLSFDSAVNRILGLLIKDLREIDPSNWRNHINDSLEGRFTQLAHARHGAAHFYPLESQLMKSKTNAPFVPLVCLSIDLLLHFAILSLDPLSNLPKGVQMQDILDIYYVIPKFEKGKRVQERKVLKKVALGRLTTEVYNSRAARLVRKEEDLATCARDLISRTKQGRMTLVLEVSEKVEIRDWWIGLG